MPAAIEVGHIEAIFRYPVKSMAGELLESGTMGWHGIEGDRRLAFRRMEDRGGFPWLSAGKLPELLLYSPGRQNGGADGHLPPHVRTPDGAELDCFGDDLAAEVSRRHGAPVQMMRLDHGIFDETAISVITVDTINEISRLADVVPDVRRFRPNILVRTTRSAPFHEEEWVGGVLSFGDGTDAPAVAVTMPDIRCSMISLDPDSARPSPDVLKTVVRVNRNNAGVYCTVNRTGELTVGQPIFLNKPG